eukprot:m.25782 g.25782  ORF g.25782 m.25782 type:complete len:408 (-) comp7997_c0_seq2:251-1474(-)
MMLWFNLAAVLSLGIVVQGQVTVPLYKNVGVNMGDDGYAVFIKATIGGQPLNLVLDTGSSALVVPTPTTTCNTINSDPCPLPVCSNTMTCVSGVYTPANSPTMEYYSSSSYAPSYCNTPTNCDGWNQCARCGFAMRYGSGQIDEVNGYLAWDEFGIDGFSADVPVGIITQLQPGWQRAPAAGTFGIGRPANMCFPGPDTYGSFGSNNPVTCPRQPLRIWMEQHKLVDKIGMCMGTPQQPGKVTFGGVDSSLFTGPIVFAPFLSPNSPDHPRQMFRDDYTLSMTGFGVGSELSQLTNRYAVVDTGTPRLLLDPDMHKQFNGASTCSQDGDCDVIFHFWSGSPTPVSLEVPGLAACSSAGTCSFTTYVTSNTQPFTIIGHAVLQHYYTVLDRTLPESFGFAQPTSACVP